MPGLNRGFNLGDSVNNPGPRTSQPTPVMGGFQQNTLKDIHTGVVQVTRDIKDLSTALEGLNRTLSRASSLFQGAFPRGRGTAAGPSTVTRATVSAGGGAGPQASAEGPGGTGVTTAGFGGSHIFSGGPGGVAARFAGAELAGQGAAGINSMMARFTGPAQSGIDVQARIAGVLSGNTNIGNLSSQLTGVRNLGPSDLGQATAMAQANPYLLATAQPGMPGFKNYRAQVNALQGLNPTMGAKGAQSILNQMTSNQFLWFLQQHGLQGQGVFNNRTGQMSNPQQMMRTLFSAASVVPVSASIARRQARSPGDVAMWSQNLQRAGITDPNVISAVVRYAAGGETLAGATGTMGQSVAAKQLTKATQGTATAQTAFESSQGAQKILLDISTTLSRILQLMAGNPLGGGVLQGGMVAAKGVGSALSTFAILKLLGVGRDVTGVGGTKAYQKIAGGAKGLASKIPFIGKLLKGGTAEEEIAAGATGAGGPGGLIGTARFDVAKATIIVMNGTVIGGGGGGIGGGGGPPKKGGGGFLSGVFGFAKKWVGKAVSNTVGRIPGAKWLGNVVQKGMNFVNKSVIGKALEKLGLPPEAVAAVEEAAPVLEEVAAAGDPVLGSQSTSGMTPQMAAGMRAMMRDNPGIKINSGHRTQSQQAALYALKGGKGVARPGQSAHQRGRAADIGPPSQLGWVAANAHRYGMYRPDPKGEPWHVQAMGDPNASSNTVSYSTSALLSAAQSFVTTPTPYQWGGMGTDPGQGLDCSRFVQEVFAKVGITLPRTTYDQVKQGSAVNGIGNAQPGDLIFYDYEGPNSHVALYIGNNQQIAAPETGKNVEVENVDTGHISAVRRIAGGTKAAAAVATAKGSASGASGSVAAAAGSMGGFSFENSFIASMSNQSGWGGFGGGAVGGAAGGGSAGTGAGAGGTTTTGTGSTTVLPGGGGNITKPSDFSKAVLSGLGLPATTADVMSINAWQQQEGQWGASGIYNATKMHDPLNTMLPMPGSTSLGGQTMSYPTWAEGVSASVSTIQQSNMAPILAALKANADLPTFTKALEGTPWASSAYGGRSFDTPTGEFAVGDPTRSSVVGIPGVRSSGGITLNMPVQVVGVSQQDAKRLVNLVMNEIKNQTQTHRVAST